MNDLLAGLFARFEHRVSVRGEIEGRLHAAHERLVVTALADDPDGGEWTFEDTLSLLVEAGLERIEHEHGLYAIAGTGELVDAEEAERRRAAAARRRSPPKFIERRDDGRYWIIDPPSIGPDGEEEGMSLERGPFRTRWGARWHLRVWG